jgi:hypothetical protein
LYGHLYKVSIRDSLQEISVRDIKVRSLFKPSKKKTLSPCFLHQVSAQDLCKRSLGKISAQLCKSISRQDLCEGPLGKIFIKGLLARSFGEISVQALYQSSLGKIYVKDLLARAQQIYAMSPYKISTRGAPARSHKISVPDLYKRSLGKICFGDLCASSL